MNNLELNNLLISKLNIILEHLNFLKTLLRGNYLAQMNWAIILLILATLKK